MKLFKKLFGGLKTPTSTMGTSPSIHLLIAEPTVTPGACADTRFGGTPSVNEGFAWPTCKGCASPLQFLGQIRPTGAQHLHLIFMCDENPVNAGSGKQTAVPTRWCACQSTTCTSRPCRARAK
ncbi:DUF1963 domain-containing protein [Pseudomonas fluorescens]|nr:DUF1963 domain-containing protein [Pseudomonas fluorescens]